MKIFKQIYLSGRIIIILVVVCFLYILQNVFNSQSIVADITLFAIFVLTLLDIILIFSKKNIIQAHRLTDAKLSNGEENTIILEIYSKFQFPLFLKIIDELPVQLQKRNFSFKTKISSDEKKNINYKIKPKERGEYVFGSLNVFCSSLIGLIRRRVVFDISETLPVYPSVISMNKYSFLAISNHLFNAGSKKIYRTGTSYEFDQIRKYNHGDDIRKINWKATSKSGETMVNVYQEEKSQNIYSIIDMGRVMQLPFENMTLLDYAINSSLALSSTAIIKNDKAGLITFAEKVYDFLPADSGKKSISSILNVLYKSQTSFKESDYESLYINISTKIKQRSLLVFFCNFETIYSLKRNMKYLAMLSKKHLLVVVIFQNTDVLNYTLESSRKVKDLYMKTMAEKYLYEKDEIKLLMKNNNIHAVMTLPKDLSHDVINKYIEIKLKGAI